MTKAEIMFNALDAYAVGSNVLTFMDADEAAHAFAAEQGISINLEIDKSTLTGAFYYCKVRYSRVKLRCNKLTPAASYKQKRQHLRRAAAVLEIKAL